LITRNNLPVLFALALLAVLIIFLATRFGIGVTPDSTVYIDAARNLVKGRGLIALAASGESKPLTHYPPLYSALLALLGLPGFSIETVARLLNSIVFGGNVLLVGVALRNYARDSFWPPIFGALLTLTAPDLAAIHTFALTEGLFILLTMGGLVSLSRFLELRQKAWLLTSAGLVALALLTRYAGVALVFACVLALLFVNGGDLRRRFLAAVTFALIACAPMLVWAIRNMRVADGASDRRFLFHPIGVRQISAGFSTISAWLLLGKVRADYRVIFFVIEVAVASLLVGYLVRRSRNSATGERAAFRKTSELSRLPIILLIFTASYVGFLIFTAFFVDVDTVLDDRALVPLHVAAILLCLCFAGKLFTFFKNSHALRIASVLLFLLFALSYSIRGGSWLLHVRQDGQGYASRAWKESETVARVKNLPAGVTIYSNGYDAIYYLTGRPAIYLSEKTNHNTGRPNENYETEVEEMRRDLEQGKTVLVYLKTLPERWFLPSEAELVQRLRPRRVEPTVDGSILSGAK
jgi:hypothetical protein